MYLCICACVFATKSAERSPLYIIWTHNVRGTYWATGTQYIWIKLQLHCFSNFFIFYISTIALASSSQEFQALPWSFNARIRFSSKPRGATYIKPSRDDDDIILLSSISKSWWYNDDMSIVFFKAFYWFKSDLLWGIHQWCLKSRRWRRWKRIQVKAGSEKRLEEKLRLKLFLQKLIGGSFHLSRQHQV